MHAASLNLETDREIIDAYRSGDREVAATTFVRKHQRFVYAVAMRQLNNTDDARDAAQETFIKALTNLEKFRQDSSISTWLYRITVNTCSSMRKKRRLLSFFAFGEGEGERDVAHVGATSPEQATITSDFERFFTTVLAALPPKQRETFCLKYYDDLSYEEISEMIGTSVGALKANYHWAVKKIAAALRESDFYERWLEHDNETK